MVLCQQLHPNRTVAFYYGAGTKGGPGVMPHWLVVWAAITMKTANNSEPNRKKPETYRSIKTSHGNTAETIDDI